MTEPFEYTDPKTPDAPPDPPPDTALHAAIQKALEAITVVVNETLKTVRPARFAEAMQICSVGQSLVRATAKTLEDFENDPNEPGADFGMADPNVGFDAVFEGIHPGAARRRALRRLGGNMPGPLDQNEVIRNLMLTLGPALQNITGVQKSQAAETEARELKALHALRQEMTSPDAVATIDARIAELLSHMDVRNKETPDESESSTANPAPLANSELSRRHPPGIEGAEDDTPLRLRAHGRRGEGDGGREEEGDFDQADRAALG